ncbi:helix-turn-helix transcriptional regulator [Ralstonia sp. UBA689]|uniref:helix-turn-helix transcriptional regulator n=1 Tax=Ralstonia sp. UBA689 TaxID=1947373 RepID=UPI0025DED678|nr:helix-turn-helix transcriptional regulator [Ralstonia sp. UBA689]
MPQPDERDGAIAPARGRAVSAPDAPTDAQQDPALLRRLLRAKDRMDAASHEAWPVKRLAEVSGISEAHFARSFKQAFGIPPHRYLLTRRIEQASTLLRDTDLPIIEIAFATGWESLGTFGRIFRDITGQSPSALRREAQATAAAQQLDRVPACVLKAAQRPDLTTAVSEKRRRLAARTNPPSTQPKEKQ